MHPRHPSEPGRRLRQAATIIASLCSAGCITHQARITPPAPAAPAAGQPADMTPTRLVVGSVIQHDLSKPIVQEDGLPIDVPVSAWRRDPDGHAYRYEGRATTPLPWWQRFPTDMFTDAWPNTLLCPASAEVVLAPVPTLDLDAFLASAARDGYAHHKQSAPPAQGSQP